MTRDRVRKRFAIILADTMTNKGITQSELSGRTGISVRTIRRYLRSEIDPRISDLELIAEALGVSRYSLLLL